MKQIIILTCLMITASSFARTLNFEQQATELPYIIKYMAATGAAAGKQLGGYLSNITTPLAERLTRYTGRAIAQTAKRFDLFGTVLSSDPVVGQAPITPVPGLPEIYIPSTLELPATATPIAVAGKGIEFGKAIVPMAAFFGGMYTMYKLNQYRKQQKLQKKQQAIKKEDLKKYIIKLDKEAIKFIQELANKYTRKKKPTPQEKTADLEKLQSLRTGYEKIQTPVIPELITLYIEKAENSLWQQATEISKTIEKVLEEIRKREEENKEISFEILKEHIPVSLEVRIEKLLTEKQSEKEKAAAEALEKPQEQTSIMRRIYETVK